MKECGALTILKRCFIPEGYTDRVKTTTLALKSHEYLIALLTVMRGFIVIWCILLSLIKYKSQRGKYLVLGLMFNNL